MKKKKKKKTFQIGLCHAVFHKLGLLDNKPLDVYNTLKTGYSHLVLIYDMKVHHLKLIIKVLYSEYHHKCPACGSRGQACQPANETTFAKGPAFLTPTYFLHIAYPTYLVWECKFSLSSSTCLFCINDAFIYTG